MGLCSSEIRNAESPDSGDSDTRSTKVKSVGRDGFMGVPLGTGRRTEVDLDPIY